MDPRQHRAERQAELVGRFLARESLEEDEQKRHLEAIVELVERALMSSNDPCKTLGEPCDNGEVCLMIDGMPDPVCSAVPDFCGIICNLEGMQ